MIRPLSPSRQSRLFLVTALALASWVPVLMWADAAGLLP